MRNSQGWVNQQEDILDDKLLHFRGFIKKTGEMYPVLELSLSDYMVFLDEPDGTGSNGVWYYFDEVEIMQISNLVKCTDKQGNKVVPYAGDIVEVFSVPKHGELITYRQVIKEQGKYTVDELNHLEHAEKLVLLGNVYNHPELLLDD